MKLAWFAIGTAVGFVLAHVLNSTPRGHDVLQAVDRRITAFTDRLSEAYVSEEARLESGARRDDAP